MADRLLNVLNNYLNDVGDVPERLGGKKVQPVDLAEPTKAEAMMWKHLETERTFNNRVFGIGLGMLAVIFVVGVFLVAARWDTPTVAAMVFGGTSVSLAAVQREVFRAWAVKVRIDLLVAILPGLPPAERLKAIQDLVYAANARVRSGPRTATSTSPTE